MQSVADTAWADFFQNWPKEMPRRGVLVTTGNEQIPFSGFLVSQAMVFLERQTPDTVGTRKVLMPFQSIQMVKICDVVKVKTLNDAGFAGTLG